MDQITEGSAILPWEEELIRLIRQHLHSGDLRSLGNGTTDREDGRSLDNRDALIPLLRMLLCKLMGDERAMIQMTTVSLATIAAIQVLVEFGIADLVPEYGAVTMDELAKNSGIEKDILTRILRGASGQGIFRKSTPGSGDISHTGLSRALSRLSPWLKLTLSTEVALPYWKLPQALSRTSNPQGRTAVEIAFNQPYWDVVEHHPESVGQTGFHAGLKCLSETQAPIASLFPWERLGSAVVYDVGGGEGRDAVNVARAYANVEFVVQDKELNRHGAAHTIPADLAGRVKFQAHDFFTHQSDLPLGPVVFLMKQILHNWPDNDCEAILRHLIPSLEREGSRLLVAERILADPATDCQRLHMRTSPVAQAEVSSMDLVMLTLFNAGERTLAQFQSLLHRVHENLDIQEVWGDAESPVKVLEVVLTQTDSKV